MRALPREVRAVCDGACEQVQALSGNWILLFELKEHWNQVACVLKERAVGRLAHLVGEAGQYVVLPNQVVQRLNFGVLQYALEGRGVQKELEYEMFECRGRLLYHPNHMHHGHNDVQLLLLLALCVGLFESLNVDCEDLDDLPLNRFVEERGVERLVLGHEYVFYGLQDFDAQTERTHHLVGNLDVLSHVQHDRRGDDIAHLCGKQQANRLVINRFKGDFMLMYYSF